MQLKLKVPTKHIVELTVLQIVQLSQHAIQRILSVQSIAVPLY